MHVGHPVSLWVSGCFLVGSALACSRDPGGAREEPQPSPMAESSHPSHTEAAAPAPKAKAILAPLAGSTLAGRAELVQKPAGVQIEVEAERAEPATRRAAVHDEGCEEARRAPRREAAARTPDETNLGTLVVDQSGRGELEVTLPGASLSEGEEGALLGKSLRLYRVAAPSQLGEREELAVACGPIAVE